jgi:preprotein translocase subunit SecE
MPSLEQTREYTGEVVDELKKVTWPDWPQLKNATIVILIFCVIVALIMWLMDTGIRTVVNMIIDLFAG